MDVNVETPLNSPPAAQRNVEQHAGPQDNLDFLPTHFVNWARLEDFSKKALDLDMEVTINSGFTLSQTTGFYTHNIMDEFEIKASITTNFDALSTYIIMENDDQQKVIAWKVSYSVSKHDNDKEIDLIRCRSGLEYEPFHISTLSPRVTTNIAIDGLYFDEQCLRQFRGNQRSCFVITVRLIAVCGNRVRIVRAFESEFFSIKEPRRTVCERPSPRFEQQVAERPPNVENLVVPMVTPKFNFTLEMDDKNLYDDLFRQLNKYEMSVTVDDNIGYCPAIAGFITSRSAPFTITINIMNRNRSASQFVMLRNQFSRVIQFQLWFKAFKDDPSNEDVRLKQRATTPDFPDYALTSMSLTSPPPLNQIHQNIASNVFFAQNTENVSAGHLNQQFFRMRIYLRVVTERSRDQAILLSFISDPIVVVD